MNFPNPFRRRAEQAAEEAAEARANPQLADLDLSDHERAIEAARIAAIVERTRRAREAQVRADDLAHRAEQLDQAVAGHAETVTAEAARIADTTQALTDSQGKVRAAAKAAEVALGRLHDAAQAHDSLVVERSAEMRAAGLVDAYVDGDAVIAFDTGGAAKGLSLGGTWWSRVDPTAAMLRSLFVVARGWHGAFAGLAGELRFRGDVQQVVQRTGDLFAPLPDPLVPPAPEWIADLGATQRAHMQGVPPSERALAEAEEQRKRDEHEAKQMSARVKMRVEQAARTGEPVFG